VGLDNPLVGVGSSRRKAEQAAAQQALEQLL
jgi:ribonuclease-3